MGVIRWGLLSTANINLRILEAAAASEEAEVVAVASRSADRARAYAAEHGLARAHGSYEDLLADAGVDAVYVSLPNGLHAEWTRRALAAGKPVLVEKPFAPAARDVEACFAEAGAAGLVLSEAFMWRHHPQAERLVERVAAGEIGELRLVRAAFSFPLDRDVDPRWEPGLDGGALMDVGCYCLSGLRLLAGEPEEVTARAVRSASGVDVRLAAALRFGGGVLGTFDCAFDLPYRASLEAVGAAGTLVLPDPWHGRDPRLELHRDGEVEVERIDPVDPYRLELEDVSRAIADGRPPRLGRDDAVGQARALERVLAAVAA